MEQYRIANATVRIHGIPDREQLKKATEEFLKTAVHKRKKEKK